MAFSFLEAVKKFNPYHDKLGRFTTAGAATLFTYRTRSKTAQGAADKAAEREKRLTAATMPTEAQTKTLKGIETRTRNLKKEQFRVVDREGNIVMQKQGDEHSVTYKMGEAREYFPGNITIHNHPSGGTFSTPDLTDIGHGATEIRAAAPEGTYILRNTRYGRKYDAAKEKTWFDMKEDLEKASANFKNETAIKKETKARYQADYDEKVSSWAKKWAEAKDSGAGQEELQKYIDKYNKANEAWQAEYKPKIEQEVRKAYVDQYHDWYKKNAYKYGLEYQFIPVKSRTQKGLLEEPVMKAAEAGDVVLDEQMNKDIRELTDKIMDEIMNPKKAKSFSDTIQKFNPYHDRLGRFTSAGGAASFTFRSDKPFMDNAINRAIEREKQRTAGGGDGAAAIPDSLKGEYKKRMTEAQMLDLSTDNVQHEIELLSVLGSDKTVKLSGMDKELAAETVEQVKKVVEKYPIVKDAVKGIQVGGEIDKETMKTRFDEKPNSMAYYNERTGYICLNKEFYNSKSDFAKKYAEGVESGFHPKGTDYNSTIVHEIGHAIDQYVSKKLYDGWEYAMGKRCSSEIWNADIDKAKKKGEPLTGKSIRANLSGYASKNSAEYLAEGFAEAFCSDSPRATAKSIVKRLENRIKKSETAGVW